jgi:hypothetical protein
MLRLWTDAEFQRQLRTMLLRWCARGISSLPPEDRAQEVFLRAHHRLLAAPEPIKDLVGFCRKILRDLEIDEPTSAARKAIRVTQPDLTKTTKTGTVRIRRNGKWVQVPPSSDIEDASSLTGDNWSIDQNDLLLSTIDPEAIEGLITSHDGMIGRFAESLREPVAEVQWLESERTQLVSPAFQTNDLMIVWSLEAFIDGEWIPTISGRGPAWTISGKTCHRFPGVQLRLMANEPGKRPALHDLKFQ